MAKDGPGRAETFWILHPFAEEVEPRNLRNFQATPNSARARHRACFCRGVAGNLRASWFTDRRRAFLLVRSGSPMERRGPTESAMANGQDSKPAEGEKRCKARRFAVCRASGRKGGIGGWRDFNCEGSGGERCGGTCLGFAVSCFCENYRVGILPRWQIDFLSGGERFCEWGESI